MWLFVVSCVCLVFGFGVCRLLYGVAYSLVGVDCWLCCAVVIGVLLVACTSCLLVFVD